jgi:crotonobetainyl-CoA:carnitine CoA-transferase CaiB-like acyl-CoA transferase
MAAESPTAGALDNIRVVEWGSSRAIAVSGMLLTELGTACLRIDTPAAAQSSDPAFLLLHRGKRILGMAEGPVAEEPLRTLIERCDVFLYSADASARLPTAIKTMIHQRRAPCICCSLPDAAGDETTAMPEANVSMAAGLYETTTGLGKPIYFSLPIVSTFAALHAVNAIVMALVARKRQATVSSIEIPLVKAGIAAQMFNVAIKGGMPRRWLPFQMLASPFMSMYPTADNRHIYIHLGVPRHLHTFVMKLSAWGFAAEKQALKSALSGATKLEPVYAGSVREAMTISRIFKALFAKQAAEVWERQLGEAGLCCVKIRTLAEWLEHPQSRTSGDIAQMSIPGKPAIRVPGPALGDLARHAAIALPQPIELADVNALWPARQRDTKPASAQATLPLQGIRVLDLSRVIAGPYCGRTLAEYGAEDSLVIDLADPRGKEAMEQVFNRFKPDIILHNFAGSGRKKIAPFLDNFRKINPATAMVSIASYNRNGPWAEWTGFEQNIQGVSGVQAAYSGIKSPKFLPVPTNDLCTGLLCSIAAGCKLLLNLQEGPQQTETEVYLSTPSYLMQLENFNADPGRPEPACPLDGRGWYTAIVRSKDGHLCAAIALARRAECGGIPELASIATSAEAALPQAIATLFRRRTTAAWEALIGARHIGHLIQIQRRNSMKAIIGQETANADPLISHEFHEGLGRTMVVHSPVSWNGHALRRMGGAHYFGQDSNQYYAQAGSSFQVQYLTKPDKVSGQDKPAAAQRGSSSSCPGSRPCYASRTETAGPGRQLARLQMREPF